MPKREYTAGELEARRVAYNARKRAWRDANPEKAKEISKRHYRLRKASNPEWMAQHVIRVGEWQRANRDKVNAWQRTYANTPEGSAKRRARVKAWNETNPERLAALSFKHHAARRGDNAPDETALQYICVLRTDPCSYCGAAMQEVDHIMSMAQGGTNDWDNLTSACRPCNRLKHSKSLLEYLRIRS